jgi:hypothetical protein
MNNLDCTYPRILGNKLSWFMWKKLCCKRGWHLWDEVYVSKEEHYLFCDACEIRVEIK